MTQQNTAPAPAALKWYMAGINTYFIAAGIQMVLGAWIVKEVLHMGPEHVGIAQACSMLAMLVLALFGGARADGQELRSYLVKLQLAGILIPLSVAGFTLAGYLSYPLVLFYLLAISALGAFVMPARDAMLTRVIDVKRAGVLQKAVASAMSRQFLSQVLGNLLAGAAGLLGPVWLFVVQGFFLAASAFTSSRLPKAPPAPREIEEGAKRPSQLTLIKEGIVLVWASERLRPVITMMFCSGVLYIGVFMVLFPILIPDIYNGGSAELAAVYAIFFSGIGLSSNVQSRLPPVRRQGRAIMLALCVGSSAMLGLHFEPPLWGVYALSFCWGLAAGVSMTQSRSIVQEYAQDEHRARILSIFQLGMMGGGPIGSFITGFIIKAIGPLDAVLVPSGTMVLVWLSMFFFSPLWKLEAPAHP
ncbi:MFS transporter [Tepidicaulis sp. LMO-SS28]|uniref:MFS transporter n=1 Tax=Tepidicaulis sp. LMO-SS28 TaxID=3447455 RepID=UPI003EE0AC1A